MIVVFGIKNDTFACFKSLTQFHKTFVTVKEIIPWINFSATITFFPKRH